MAYKKYIPGPWATAVYGDPPTIKVVKEYEQLIATVYQLDESFDTIYNTASLIAAAPELLEALEALADPRNWDWQDDDGVGGMLFWIGQKDPIQTAKDAIAKATGGEE